MLISSSGFYSPCHFPPFLPNYFKFFISVFFLSLILLKFVILFSITPFSIKTLKINKYIDLFTEDDARQIIQQIDLNNDGIIEWNEFLKVISDWLLTFSNKEEPSETDSQQSASAPLKRKKLHDKISKFFYQFKNDLQFNSDSGNENEKVEDLENRADEWNFFAEKVFVPSLNKVFF